jgi:ferredoxin
MPFPHSWWETFSDAVARPANASLRLRCRNPHSPITAAGAFPTQHVPSIPMSLKILDTCVNCDVCEPACPNQAISLGEEFYVIDPALCTECVGHHDEPQCMVVCPVECIILDPERVETPEQLEMKYRQLMAKESRG